MNIIQNNPYRILGVYSNAPTKERLANHNRMKAFLKVGKSVAFPLDLPQYLSAIERTEETVAKAEAELTLPKDQLQYALFWFVKMSSFDELAFKYLLVGDMAKAEEIWTKKPDASSLQNRIACALIKEDYVTALSCAELLYDHAQFQHLADAVVGNDAKFSGKEMVAFFLDTLCEEAGTDKILPLLTIPDWKARISEKAIEALLEEIEEAVAIAKASRGKGAKARLEAGRKLQKDTRRLISKLGALLLKSDVQYQMTADKLGLEILQCGIDYYNKSDEAEAARDALSLANYAQSIVVGAMAKERCYKNKKVMAEAEAKLPPIQVMEHHNAIQSFLRTFAGQPELIENSILLIKNCVPEIVAIKERLGNAHPYYLKISTAIVKRALDNIIAEVNSVHGKSRSTVIKTLQSAWHAQLYLDKFDLEPEYEQGSYNEKRQTLHDIVVQYFGWLPILNCSDVDLRTDSEIYASCNDLTSLRKYVERFPSGKHTTEAYIRIEDIVFDNSRTIEDVENFIKDYPRSRHLQQAKVKLEEFRFNACKTYGDYRQFIHDFPQSKFVLQADAAMRKIVADEKEKEIAKAREWENARERRIAKERQDRALARCRSVDEVIAVYAEEKSKGINIDTCSLKAFDLSNCKADYERVASIFGSRSLGGQRAQAKLELIERKQKERAKRKALIFKWSLFAFAVLLILIIVYLIWGMELVGLVCGIFAAILFTVSIGCFIDGKSKGSIYVVIAIVLGLWSVGVSLKVEDSDKVGDSDKSKLSADSVKSEPVYLDTCVYESIPTLEVELNEEEQTVEDDYTYIDNQLKTGTKPYKSFYKTSTGGNYMDFKTSSGRDYVIIVRDYSTSDVVNHTYVRGGDSARLYLPDGTYNVYFYCGIGWNPNMDNGNVVGGFVSSSSIQKDGPVDLYNQYLEYTLYPVHNGNLQLQSASASEAF